MEWREMDWRKLQLDGNEWEWMNTDEIDGNKWKLVEMAGSGWNGCTAQGHNSDT